MQEIPGWDALFAIMCSIQPDLFTFLYFIPQCNGPDLLFFVLYSLLKYWILNAKMQDVCNNWTPYTELNMQHNEFMWQQCNIRLAETFIATYCIIFLNYYVAYKYIYTLRSMQVFRSDQYIYPHFKCFQRHKWVKHMGFVYKCSANMVLGFW